jgi:4-carboxymuconolactone decarboxylase
MPFSKPLPPDIDPESLSRLPAPRREELDDEGKALFDFRSRPDPQGLNKAGLRGPGGLWLRLPRYAGIRTEENRYLRTQTGLAPHLVEVVILSTARGMHSQFEWTMHEPMALACGVPPEVIDAIRTDADTGGVDPACASVIDLVREALAGKGVAAATYARALALHGEIGLLKIVALVGHYASTAIALAVFDQQLHPGQTPLLPPAQDG